MSAAQIKERFCMYCRTFRLDKGFRFVVHLASNTKRGMCPLCQERRKLPRPELQRLADQERQARREQASRAALKSAEKRE